MIHNNYLPFLLCFTCGNPVSGEYGNPVSGEYGNHSADLHQMSGFCCGYIVCGTQKLNKNCIYCGLEYVEFYNAYEDDYYEEDFWEEDETYALEKYDFVQEALEK